MSSSAHIVWFESFFKCRCVRMQTRWIERGEPHECLVYSTHDLLLQCFNESQSMAIHRFLNVELSLHGRIIHLEKLQEIWVPNGEERTDVKEREGGSGEGKKDKKKDTEDQERKKLKREWEKDIKERDTLRKRREPCEGNKEKERDNINKDRKTLSRKRKKLKSGRERHWKGVGGEVLKKGEQSTEERERWQG